VFLGIVQWRRTSSPARAAVKSFTGAGSHSVGGCGFAASPHPASNTANPDAAATHGQLRPKTCREHVGLISAIFMHFKPIAFSENDAAR
jgi:hypothetical protein